MRRPHERERAYENEERPVHTEPMHATLGDKLGDVDVLRERIEGEERDVSTDTARERFMRSLNALDSTVRRSAKDIGSALTGTFGCAVAWARAETRALTGGKPAELVTSER